MKKLSIIFLILVVLFANFQQLILLSVYQFNKDYFTKNFCENIDVPEKNCLGQCYINKSIAEQNEEKSTKDFSFKWKEVEIYFNKISITIEKIVCKHLPIQRFFNYKSKIFAGIAHLITHPPRK